jgi:sugar phosphate permease
MPGYTRDPQIEQIERLFACCRRLLAPRPAGCYVFYGWIVAGLCLAIRVTSLAAASMNPMVFLAPALTSDPSIAGLTPTRLAMIYLVSNWVGATTGPPLGFFLDYAGARRCLVGALLALSAAMAGLSVCSSWPAFLVAFLCIRTIFRSALEEWCIVPINIWFDKRRGRAVAIFAVGETLLSNVLGMVLYEWATERFGWRLVQRAMALLLAAVALPTALYLRDDPESVGCAVDGADPGGVYAGVSTVDGADPVESAGTPDAVGERSAAEGPAIVAATIVTPPAPAGKPTVTTRQHQYTVREAMCTRAIYVLCADQFVSTALICGVLFNLVPIIQESRDGDVNVAVEVLVPSGLAYGVMSLAAGSLIDRRVQTRFLVAFSNVLAGTGMVMLAWAARPGFATGYGVCNGMQLGVKQMVYRTVWAQFYGRAHLGAIHGISNTVGVVSTGAGPLAFTVARFYAGDFRSILLANAAAAVVLAAWSLTMLRQPSRPPAP